MEVRDIVQETVIKPSPRKRNAKRKKKWLSEEVLQITVRKRETKIKGKRKDIPI